jgi:hypothetical protein
LSLVGISASLLIYATLIIISLWRKLSIVRNDVKRRQVELFGLALVFPAGLMFILLPLTQLGWSLPHIFGIGELVSVVVLGYAISHYHLMVPPRVRENASIRYRRVPALEKGHAYLFESQDPSRMFDSVLQEMEEGLSVLIICRTHPDQLRAQYQLTQTPMIWLAQSPGPDRIDPCNLQMLTHVIMKYMSKERSLIAIEGLEYLMVNNELNKLLRFIGQLRDNIIVENSILLVTVDPRTLTDRLQAILQRELESVVEKEGAETAI